MLLRHVIILASLLSQTAMASIDKNEQIKKTKRTVDPTSLTFSADDRSVDGAEGDLETAQADQGTSAQEEKVESEQDADAAAELDKKDDGTADVQVVYRVRGSLDSKLRGQVEVEMSEALCDDPYYEEDCQDNANDSEIEIQTERRKLYDVISYDVIDRDNGESPEEERMRSIRRAERSTEVVYRKDSDPAYDRSYRIRMREQGSNKVYIATLKESDQNDEAQQDEDNSSSKKTLWLDRLERANGEEG